MTIQQNIVNEQYTQYINIYSKLILTPGETCTLALLVNPKIYIMIAQHVQGLS